MNLLRLPKKRVLHPDQSYLPFLGNPDFPILFGNQLWRDEDTIGTGSRLLRDHSKGPVCWAEKSLLNYFPSDFSDRFCDIIRKSRRGFGTKGALLRRPKTILINSGNFDIFNAGDPSETAGQLIINIMEAELDKFGIDLFFTFSGWPGFILAGMPSKTTTPIVGTTVTNVFNVDTPDQTIITANKLVECATEFPEVLGGDLFVISSSFNCLVAYFLTQVDIPGGAPFTFYPELWPDTIASDQGVFPDGVAKFRKYKNYVQILLQPDGPTDTVGVAEKTSDIISAAVDGLPVENFELDVRMDVPDIFAEKADCVDSLVASIRDFFNIPVPP